MVIWSISEPKAVKVFDVIASGGRLNGFFLNEKELAFLIQKMPQGSTPKDLSSQINGYVIETKGDRGVSVWYPNWPIPVNFSLSNHQGNVLGRKHWLGAGDHLLALTLFYHLMEGITLEVAACKASKTVSDVHPRHNCNLGDANPLETRLKQLNDIALLDSLTGLCNRFGLRDSLNQLEDRSSIAVLMVDLDHFKNINDTHGHDVGDLVLRETGKILRHATRGTDIPCRWGGEEMLVVLPNIDVKTAYVIAERIRSQLEQHRFDFGTVTCTIGLSLGSLGDFDNVRSIADSALYDGKRSGRNRVIIPQHLRMERMVHV